MMAKFSANGSRSISTLIDEEMDADMQLCEFSVDNQEFLALKLGADSDAEIVHPYIEICRFKVNDCLCAIVKKAACATEEADLSEVLSVRELQIASLVALGCPNKQVADRLRISEWTVATYLRRIFAKLRVDTRAAMTYRCASLIDKQDIFLKTASNRPTNNGLSK